MFEDTTAAVIENYDPSAIVLQCGADSLGGDRLGQFNVSIKAGSTALKASIKA